jgi:hypothetical protein
MCMPRIVLHVMEATYHQLAMCQQFGMLALQRRFRGFPLLGGHSPTHERPAGLLWATI